jgi:hypothetical protein
VGCLWADMRIPWNKALNRYISGVFDLDRSLPARIPSNRARTRQRYHSLILWKRKDLIFDSWDIFGTNRFRNFYEIHINESSFRLSWMSMDPYRSECVVIGLGRPEDSILSKYQAYNAICPIGGMSMGRHENPVKYSAKSVHIRCIRSWQVPTSSDTF